MTDEWTVHSCKLILHINTRYNSLPLFVSTKIKTAHLLCLYYLCFPCVLYVDAVIAQNNALWWHVPPGWSTLMKLCEIQPIRLLHPSTSTNRPPSCTRFCSWVQFSCCMTAPAWTRWEPQTVLRSLSFSILSLFYLDVDSIFYLLFYPPPKVGLSVGDLTEALQDCSTV